MLSTAPALSAQQVLLSLELLEVKVCSIHFFQHAMVIDSRNSSILPRRGALLKVNQVVFSQSQGSVHRAVTHSVEAGPMGSSVEYLQKWGGQLP